MTRPKSKRRARPNSEATATKPVRIEPTAEAPDAGLLRQQAEAPDAGEGRAHLIETEFTHGRSQS